METGMHRHGHRLTLDESGAHTMHPGYLLQLETICGILNLPESDERLLQQLAPDATYRGADPLSPIRCT